MFESLDVPVFHDADVVIAGAGPAGIGAAIASAMQGRKTVLLEQTGSAGGMSTNSLIPIILHQGTANGSSSAISVTPSSGMRAPKWGFTRCIPSGSRSIPKL